MIDERSYGLRAEFDGDDVFLINHGYIVICDGKMPDAQEAEDQLYRDVSFITHHGSLEIYIIAYGYNDYDEARQSVIETLFNARRVIDCATISDAMTPDDANKHIINDIPF